MSSRAWVVGAPRFDRLLQLVVIHGDRHLHVDRNAPGGPDEEWDVAPDQRALREDRQGSAGCRECLDDPRHELVAALGTLVRIGVRAERDGLVLPAALAQLLLEHVHDVDLHDDLRVEVGSSVEVEVLMGAASETVKAGMTASAVRVDRPREGHARSARNMVQRGLRQHLVERHPREIGGRHRPQHARPVFETGERRRILLSELLSLPAHASFEHVIEVNASEIRRKGLSLRGEERIDARLRGQRMPPLGDRPGPRSAHVRNPDAQFFRRRP